MHLFLFGGKRLHQSVCGDYCGSLPRSQYYRELNGHAHSAANTSPHNCFDLLYTVHLTMNNKDKSSLVSEAVKTSAFAQSRAPQPLRVCCFGSSSSQTPAAYLRPAAAVGYLLAVRGHTCVNGAGSFGCMAALNEGAVEGNGHIVGVIHKMWLKEGEDVKQKNAWGLQRPLRDGGAHAVFRGNDAKNSAGDAPIRELVVTGGKDLQERKKLLIQNADGLIVLPGGPGTFDEVSVNCVVLQRTTEYGICGYRSLDFVLMFIIIIIIKSSCKPHHTLSCSSGRWLVPGTLDFPPFPLFASTLTAFMIPFVSCWKEPGMII